MAIPEVIVVGAGPAGCTAAWTLAQAGASVTLVDAGPTADAPLPLDIFDSLDRFGRPYLAVVRTSRQSQRNYCAGAGVGGSALVNGLLMTRPDAAELASSWDLDGWTTERLSRGFEQLFRGGSILPLSSDGTRLGDGSARPSWTDALSSVSMRPRAAVESVLISRGRAQGVRLTDGTALLSDRVLLGAGAIETPRLLWRSGLTLPGIGQNLCDHPSLPFTCILGVEPVGLGPDVLVTTYPERDLLLVTLLRARSRGWMTPDCVYLNQLDHPADRAALRAAVRSLAGAALMAGDQPIAELSTMDDHRLDEWLLHHEDGTFHIAGTCRMGDSDDPGAVCDPTGRVLGVSGLFVADASIFPSLPVATPMATVMLVAAEIATGVL